jgi:hypothetical protein
MSGKRRRVVVRVTSFIRMRHDNVGFGLLQKHGYLFCQICQAVRSAVVSNCKINYAVFRNVGNCQRREAFLSARLGIVTAFLEAGGFGIVHIAGRAIGNMKNRNVD